MRLRIPCMLVLAILMAPGCGDKAPEKPPEVAVKPPPPPKTAQVLFNETMQKLRPALVSGSNRGAMVKLVMTEAKSTFLKPTEPNGKQALSMIKNTLNETLLTANKGSRWNTVLTACSGLEVLAQSDSDRKKIKRYRSRARAELDKPQIRVKGFFNEYVFLEVFLPANNKTISARVRKGEEFAEDPTNPSRNLLRLERIIGDNKSVEVFYFKTDGSWIVKGL